MNTVDTIQAELNVFNQRLMLIEGGNTKQQADVTNELRALNKSIKQLAENFSNAIISMRSELGLSIDGVEEQLTANIDNVKLTLNQKFDKLLDYLQAWVGVGNVNMDDVKSAVNQ